MSDQSRRKLLKSIAFGSGVVVAGKTLPDNWSRPVVDSVMLPTHAQTSGINLYGQITAGNIGQLDSDTLMASQESVLDNFISPTHAGVPCYIYGQCASVNIIGDSGTVSVSNAGSSPVTLDASNMGTGTVDGVPFLLKLNADRSAGNLIFQESCGGYTAALFPYAGCRGMALSCESTNYPSLHTPPGTTVDTATGLYIEGTASVTPPPDSPNNWVTWQTFLDGNPQGSISVPISGSIFWTITGPSGITGVLESRFTWLSQQCSTFYNLIDSGAPLAPLSSSTSRPGEIKMNIKP